MIRLKDLHRPPFHLIFCGVRIDLKLEVSLPERFLDHTFRTRYEHFVVRLTLPISDRASEGNRRSLFRTIHLSQVHEKLPRFSFDPLFLQSTFATRTMHDGVQADGGVAKRRCLSPTRLPSSSFSWLTHSRYWG